MSSSNSSPPYYFDDSSEDRYERTKIERRALRSVLFQEMIEAENQQMIVHHRKRRINRAIREGYQTLYDDYSAEELVYSNTMFRRRFRMRRHLFLCLVNAAKSSSQYFQQRPDTLGEMGLSPLYKCTTTICILVYREAAHRGDEFLRLGETTSRDCLINFTEVTISQFGPEYMRSPTVADVQRLLQIGAARGFPGMLGIIYCMHWTWKNCQVAWQGQFQGRTSRPIVILKAVASHDLWIWHSYFSTPSSTNDLNVLHRSPVFDNLSNGRAPRVSYTVNGHHYDTWYYLMDGIYLRWATFIPSVRLPQTSIDRLFSKKQENARKNVERAFGVLQARFAIIRKAVITWDEVKLGKIMKACMILHNMIIEDERDSYAGYANPNEYIEETHDNVQNQEYVTCYIIDIHRFLSNKNVMQDQDRHIRLKNDIIEHIYQRFGQAN